MREDIIYSSAILTDVEETPKKNKNDNKTPGSDNIPSELIQKWWTCFSKTNPYVNVRKWQERKDHKTNHKKRERIMQKLQRNILCKNVVYFSNRFHNRKVKYRSDYHPIDREEI